MNWVFCVMAVAAVLHVLEEYAWPGGFPAFMRGMAPRFAASITTPFAVVINGAFLLLCTLAAIVGPAAPVLGLSVAGLLIVNGLTHIGGAMRARRYAPGMVSGILLYLPLGAYAFYAGLTSGRASLRQVLLAGLLGLACAAVPLVWLGLASLRRRAHVNSESSRLCARPPR